MYDTLRCVVDSNIQTYGFQRKIPGLSRLLQQAHLHRHAYSLMHAHTHTCIDTGLWWLTTHHHKDTGRSPRRESCSHFPYSHHRRTACKYRWLRHSNSGEYVPYMARLPWQGCTLQDVNLLAIKRKGSITQH